MTDLTTYRIQDFVLFSRDVLFEIYEAYNQDFWPLQIVWIALAMSVGYLATRPGPLRSRVLLGILATGWIWVGAVFHLRYFLAINWAARYLAWLFFFEAILILAMVWRGYRMITGRSFRRITGLALFFLSAFIPWELLLGMPFTQVLPFGWGPLRTASGSIGLFLLLQSQGRWLLIIPPLLYLLLESLIFLGLK